MVTNIVICSGCVPSQPGVTAYSAIMSFPWCRCHQTRPVVLSTLSTPRHLCVINNVPIIIHKYLHACNHLTLDRALSNVFTAIITFSELYKREVLNRKYFYSVFHFNQKDWMMRSDLWFSIQSGICFFMTNQRDILMNTTAAWIYSMDWHFAAN